MRKTIEKHTGTKKYRDKWLRCLDHGKYKQYNNKIFSTHCQRCTRFLGDSNKISKGHMRVLLNQSVTE